MLNLTPLQSRLLPEVSDISTLELEIAFFPLTESYLSAEVLPHPRFKKRILQAVLADWEVDLTASAVQFEKEHILQAILKLPPKLMFLSLGLSWCANVLALEAFRGQDGRPGRLHDFPTNEVSFALRLRNLACTKMATLPDLNAIRQEGLLCFCAWSADIPNSVQRLIEYSFGTEAIELPEHSGIPEDEREERIALCGAWCEMRMTELAHEADDEDAETVTSDA